MNKFGSVGKKVSKEANEKVITDDSGNINLQDKRITNLGDAKSDRDAISLRSVAIILNQFKDEIAVKQLETNQYFSEDINRLTVVHDSPDNLLVRLKDKGLFVKQSIRVSATEIDAGNKVIANVENPKNKRDAVNLATLLTSQADYEKKISDYESYNYNIENVIVNILERLLQKKPVDQQFIDRMKRKLVSRNLNKENTD